MSRKTIIDDLEIEARTEGKDWAPLKAGLFGGSLERYLQILAALAENLTNSGIFR